MAAAFVRTSGSRKQVPSYVVPSRLVCFQYFTTRLIVLLSVWTHAMTIISGILYGYVY